MKKLLFCSNTTMLRITKDNVISTHFPEHEMLVLPKIVENMIGSLNGESEHNHYVVVALAVMEFAVQQGCTDIAFKSGHLVLDFYVNSFAQRGYSITTDEDENAHTFPAIKAHIQVTEFYHQQPTVEFIVKFIQL